MLIASLPADERERLQPFLDHVDLEVAQVLIEPNQPISHVWFPYDAVTSTLQLLQNGDAIEAGLMGLEGVVGLQLWLRVSSTPSKTLVQVPGSAIRMRAEHFVREVVGKPESPLNALVGKCINGFLMMTSQTAACNRVHQIDERLCRWLRMVYNRVPKRKEVPLRQEFLAMMLGVARPTVSTAASILQKAGYVDYRRGRLSILNPEGLANGACECLQLMESQYDRIFANGWRPK